MRPIFQHLSDWWRERLSRQIVLPAVVVTLLFLAALGFVAFSLGQQAVMAQVEARNRQLAVQVGQEITIFFQTQLDTLRLQEPELIDNSDPQRPADALVGLRSRFPYVYNDLLLLNARSQATMALTGTLTQVLERGVTRFDPPVPYPGDTDLQQALEQRRIGISPVAFRPITSSPYVTMTLPLGECSGTELCPPQAVLRAQIDLRSFWTKVDSFRIAGGSVSIVDQRGIILAHPDRRRVGQALDQAAIAPVFQGYEGTTIYTQNGETYLAAYSPIGNLLGWGVIVEQERDEALVLVRNIALATTLATLLSAASLILLLSSLVRRTVQPVEALSRAAAQIASSGDLRTASVQHIVPRSASSAEIGMLAASFNHMIDGLRTAQEQMQRWNEELEQRVAERTAQLHTLLEVARLSSGSLDERAVLHTLLEQIERLVAYDTATVMLLDSTGTALETVAASGIVGSRQRRVHALNEFPLNEMVIEARMPKIVANTQHHPLWRVREREGAQSGSWMGVPLLVKDQAIGVLGLFKMQPDFYNNEDVSLVTALASQVAIALAHARLYAESVQRVEQELRVAQQIQRHLFPDHAPPVKGLQIASFYRPAQETTGDFYVFVLPPNHLVPGGNGATPPPLNSFDLIIGDVSGKSLPAALLMAMARTALHTAARTRQTDPAEILDAANMVLVGEIPPGSFVASSYVRFDRATHSCALVNAGQPAPLLVRDQQVLLIEGAGSHLPLGVVAAPGYRSLLVTLQPGDLLLFYTDGVVESFNRARMLFGFEHLEEVARSCAATDLSPQQVVERIIAELKQWMGDVPQHDDIAIVAVRVTAEWN